MLEPAPPASRSVADLFAAQKAAFAAAPRRTLEERRADLRALEEALGAARESFVEAVDADFGRRSAWETQLTEIGFVIAGARHARRCLGRWMRPAGVSSGLLLALGQARIERTPKGVVGIIAPWNYPIQLALAPLVAALAGGNRAIVKPSELTPRTSDLLKEVLGRAFDETQVAVVTGGPETAQALCALPLDHLFFTGSTRVGRLVAQAAAAHLTPVTLELGGKSPAIVCEDFPLAAAAKLVAWGKFVNAGQTCIAPDYVLCTGGRAEAFAEGVLAAAHAAFPAPAENADYTHIISDRHFERLAGLVAEAEAGGARVLRGPAPAGANGRVLPPTVVLDPPLEGALMREEIFGPVLPVIGCDDVAAATRFVADRPHPLALYAFTRRRAQARAILDATQSGGAGVNAPLLHMAVEDLPFGGVGESGVGAYHGKAGFDAFTHARSVFAVPPWHPSRIAMPPYRWGAKLVGFLQTRL